MDFIKSLDISLFYFINHSLENSFFNILMPIITEFRYWRFPLLIGFLTLFFFGGKKGKKTFYICLITLILSDLLTNRLLKEIFQQARPFKVLENVNLPSGTAGGYSFPSSHAANIFSSAIIISYIWRKVWIYIFTLGIAALVGFSRVYVGVHFPLDVLAGTLLAIIYAFLGIRIFKILKLTSSKLTNKTKTAI